jgi:hypothetical protein
MRVVGEPRAGGGGSGGGPRQPPHNDIAAAFSKLLWSHNCWLSFRNIDSAAAVTEIESIVAVVAVTVPVVTLHDCCFVDVMQDFALTVNPYAKPYS